MAWDGVAAAGGLRLLSWYQSTSAPAPVVAPMAPPMAVDQWVGAVPTLEALSQQLAQIQAELNALLAAQPTAPAPKPVPKPAPAPKPKPKPAPKPQGPTSQQLFAHRKDWFISQYRSSAFNSREDVPGYDNANCGPTSLTMVATAFGKINPSAAQADAAIEKSRAMMRDGNDQRSGTSCEGIARGARAYGLDADIIANVDLADIKRELAKGRLPVINGNLIRANGTYGGGHFYVVTKIEGDKAYLNDPAIPTGPRVVSTRALMTSINGHWGRQLISIGKGA